MPAAMLIGKKIGMTRIFDADGKQVPVTVIEAGPCFVSQVKTADNDGYDAIQLGFQDLKARNSTMPLIGHDGKAGITPKRIHREVRLKAEDVGTYELGQELKVDLFEAVKFVDVIGTSKGRGFGGVMKSFHFKGFERTHGAHEYFRHGGSIGTRLTPGMTLAGKKMPGQLGNARTTVQKIEVVRIDDERNLVFVRGGVPGPNGGFVTLRQSVKGN